MADARIEAVKRWAQARHLRRRHVVLAGINRDDLGALIFPRLDEARRLFKLPELATPAEVLAHPEVRAFFQTLVDRLWANGTGSANRVARALLLEEPPHIDAPPPGDA